MSSSSPKPSIDSCILLTGSLASCCENLVDKIYSCPPLEREWIKGMPDGFQEQQRLSGFTICCEPVLRPACPWLRHFFRSCRGCCMYKPWHWQSGRGIQGLVSCTLLSFLHSLWPKPPGVLLILTSLPAAGGGGRRAGLIPASRLLAFRLWLLSSSSLDPSSCLSFLFF